MCVCMSECVFLCAWWLLCSPLPSSDPQDAKHLHGPGCYLGHKYMAGASGHAGQALARPLKKEGVVP